VVAVKISKFSKILEEVAPGIPKPLRELEQYTTPAHIALRVAQHAKLSGLLDESIVVDLGAGTCRLSLAALLLGAPKAVAVDIDRRLQPLCMEAARRLGLESLIEFIVSRISRDTGPISYCGDCIVVTNPPFGVWRRGVDTEFILYALSLKPARIYAILKSGNLEYHRGLALSRGYDVKLLWTLKFPIPASMEHHRSRVRRVDVDVLCYERKGG
jgi:predicted RNA methylase